MKKVQQKPTDKQILDVLKKLTSRVEDATVDIHSIKFDVKAMKLDMMRLESNSSIMKVDIERIREEIEELEIRLGKRITNIADLITVSQAKNFKNVEKRIQKLEQFQQTV